MKKVKEGYVKIFIGIDNGTTGTIAFIGTDGYVAVYPIPVKKELSYTKKKQYITRINTNKLRELIKDNLFEKDIVFCLVERPMLMPARFKASVSAMRALEATLIVLEELKLPYQFEDSKAWQAALLPKGLDGSELKEAGMQVAKRLFPKLDIKTKDADGLLLAEYAKRTYP